MQKNQNRGFTLIELLVVIAIIGILATVVTGSFNSIRKQARANTAKSDVEAMAADIQTYISSHINPSAIATSQTGIKSNEASWAGFWTNSATLAKQKVFMPPGGSDVIYKINISTNGKKYTICAGGASATDLESVLPSGKLYWVANNGEFYDSADCPNPSS